MKRVFHLLLVALSAALMLACSPEERKDLSDNNEHQPTLTGSYALNEGTGLTTRFLSFSNGIFYDFHLNEGEEAVVNAEGYLWHCSKGDFTSVKSEAFSIVNGQLLCAGLPVGTVGMMNNEIFFKGENFTLFKGFKSTWYSKVSVAGNEGNYSYRQQTVKWTIDLSRTVPASIPVATSDSDWMSNFAIADGKLSFLLSENNTGKAREGQVSVTCPGAENIKISVTQNYVSSEILLEKTSLETDYQGGEFSFTYSIDNPREGAPLSVVSQNDWITDVRIVGNTVNYKISENNSGSFRDGVIHIAYGDYATNDFIVNQSYAESEISLTPSSQSVDYKGGLFSFEYTVSNPRTSLMVKVDCQESWITNVSIIGNCVSYKVEENPESSRAGIIRLSYGTISNREFTILQGYGNDPSAANCYIISSPGNHQFKAVMGNTKQRVGDISSVKVLWESYGTDEYVSVGSVVGNVSYSSSTNMIQFSTPSILKNGNAVIAAKDAKGTILWSWHIWVCADYDPVVTAQVYKDYYSTKMMDRNLGATSAMPGDVGALGLLYQWGRKDPFLSGNGISSSTIASKYGNGFGVRTTSSWAGRISYTIEHPMTLICGIYDSKYDWYYPVDGEFDDKRWSWEKTIYDPCPPGWKVPRYSVWGDLNSIPKTYKWDFINKGVDFSEKFGSNSITWYPAAGFYTKEGGSLKSVGESGSCWSSQFSASFSGKAIALDFSDNTTYCITSVSSAGARSVRCQKE